MGNRQGTQFSCAGGDSCCAGACVGMGDVCCKNVNGDGFPCQGQGGGCCGNACYAPGSKCCKSHFKPKSQWYPVTKETKCADGFVGFTQEEANETSDSTLDVAPADEFIDLAQEEVIEEATEISDSTSDVTSETRRRLPPTHCRNRQGTSFECAGGDHCCVGACVGRGDVCCVNVNGDGFPCQGGGGGCCGNACYAPGSKCCRSPFKPKSRWYPVTKATRCASGFFGYPF